MSHKKYINLFVTNDFLYQTLELRQMTLNRWKNIIGIIRRELPSDQLISYEVANYITSIPLREIKFNLRNLYLTVESFDLYLKDDFLKKHLYRLTSFKPVFKRRQYFYYFKKILKYCFILCFNMRNKSWTKNDDNKKIKTAKSAQDQFINGNDQIVPTKQSLRLRLLFDFIKHNGTHESFYKVQFYKNKRTKRIRSNSIINRLLNVAIYYYSKLKGLKTITQVFELESEKIDYREEEIAFRFFPKLKSVWIISELMKHHFDSQVTRKMRYSVEFSINGKYDFRNHKEFHTPSIDNFLDVILPTYIVKEIIEKEVNGFVVCNELIIQDNLIGRSFSKWRKKIRSSHVINSNYFVNFLKFNVHSQYLIHKEKNDIVFRSLYSKIDNFEDIVKGSLHVFFDDNNNFTEKHFYSIIYSKFCSYSNSNPFFKVAFKIDHQFYLDFVRFFGITFERTKKSTEIPSSFTKISNQTDEIKLSNARLRVRQLLEEIDFEL